MKKLTHQDIISLTTYNSEVPYIRILTKQEKPTLLTKVKQIFLGSSKPVPNFSYIEGKIAYLTQEDYDLWLSKVTEFK